VREEEGKAGEALGEEGEVIMLKRYISLLAALGAVAALAAPAQAEVKCGECSPWWHLSLQSLPANLPPGGEGRISVFAEDLGDAGPSASSPVILRDRLPAGLTAQSVSLGLPEQPAQELLGEAFCSVLPREVTCTLPGFISEFLPLYGRPYAGIEAYIKVKVSEAAKSGEVSEASISGGGAPEASLVKPLVVDPATTPFGVEQYELRPENADGSPDTQAGSHPFQLTTVLGLNQTANGLTPPAAVKDLRFKLPPGLVGNPMPFPQCPIAKFTGTGSFGGNACPDNTVVGSASVTIALLGLGGAEDLLSVATPLFVLVPSVGEPARFGFDVASVPVYLDTSVRAGSDYGVTVTVPNISEVPGFISSRVTFWGVPGDPRHDSVRGWNCIGQGVFEHAPPCTPFGQATPPPLLTLPTSCTGAPVTTLEADSWQQEEAFTSPFPYTFLDSLGRRVGMDGCNQLPFTPSISVAPDGQAGSTPTGLTVGVHVPQEEALNPTGLAPAQVKDTTVTLPEGVALNPAAADGLLSCSLGQIALESSGASECPETSKVGTVEVKTPLLPNPLTGAAYLAAQDQNPFDSLVALYVFVEDPISGSRVKLAGEVKPDPVTGQLVSTFLNTPQLPFEDFRLHFFGGDRAPLGTPSLCGSYTTMASISPWSGNPPAEASSTFDIVSGPNGSACSDPLPFSPELTAGSVNIQTGAFSPFTMTMSRQDGQQDLKAVQLRMPPGLLGTLSSVKLCDEAHANAGTCGPESLIGETIVSVGLGGDPFSVRGGRVYITGPYEGAPFGLSIVNPAKAGPFDLGQVIVRAKIEVDPATAALTVTTDSTGPFAIPQMLDGIPLQIKHVNVTINRPDFTFNPTNCAPMAITGSLMSSQGSTGALSVPFQVTNCATLAFKPVFKVSTNGKTSRANGASLDVKLSYPKAAWGSQANIRYVKVDLPKQLPSRLETLKRACVDSVFRQDPAGCPPASRVGTATATTPIIPVPLSGPAYFVSHGGTGFPELIVALSGYGVTVYLHGETFISKQGITSSTFHYVPDVPIGSFELHLPQGPYSALAANGNLCTSTLRMPTTFTAQNGMSIRQSTPITPTGCPKHKPKRHNKHRHKHKHKKK
jgi:hypothetical protein